MFDQYRSIELIGAGGVADVYKVEDIWSGTIYARKALRRVDADSLIRFRREKDFYVEQRSNRHIIGIVDWNLDGPQPYLILPYSELGSLQQFVTNRQPWQRVVQWFCDVAVGLAPVFHVNGFHGDPKPSNLLLFQNQDGTDLVLVTDFGFGQRPNLLSVPMTRSPRGTPEYMDPDLRNGAPYTWRHDMHALGRSMRELLTGCRDKSIFSFMPGPPALAQLIDSMTDPEPQKRPDIDMVYQTLRDLINVPMRMPVQTKQGSGSGWWWLLGAAAVAYATANSYDDGVQRFRDSDGRFRGGRWR